MDAANVNGQWFANRLEYTESRRFRFMYPIESHVTKTAPWASTDFLIISSSVPL
ncbi:Uncharacterized protein APZ42_004632 [Daphnia magna]|uniref:Uncharacterized protein n=1 Tax=Daphnia magna TaxID=35525 RepID=A0A164GXM4_9CRUS|nr:Uncharacterized protein APZ42_004632 [Daphnia magna]